MFWGVTLEIDKRYTQTVEASFHLSMAALDPNPPSNVDVTKNSTVSLWLQHDKAEFLLCTLEYGKLYQQRLDCNFTEGEEVTFFVNGKGVIHLTGYLIEDMSMADESMMEPMMSSSEDDDDDSEESDDIPVLVDAKQFAKGAKKRSKDMKAGNKKKIKMEGEDDESSSEYSETGDEDDEDDDDDDEEDDSSEEDSTEDSDDGDHDKMTDKKALKGKPENAKRNNSNSQTKAAKEQKLSKKLKNKDKKNIANEMPSAAGDEESIDKSSLDASLTADKKKKKKKKKPVKTAESSSAPNTKQEPSDDSKGNSRVLASGLVVEDTLVGQGAEARIGRQVHVYYNGKLAKTGKMFDRCQNGKPFRFTLGKREVIPGWEKGLVGMRVGGKRKLTIPAKLGYGSQQIGPIPPNSPLIFDIELKGLS